MTMQQTVTPILTFAALPQELRLLIWTEACFQPRIVYVKFLRTRKKREPTIPRAWPEDDFPGTYYSPTKAPSILHVCHEAREVGLKYYQRSLTTYFHPTIDKWLLTDVELPWKLVWQFGPKLCDTIEELVICSKAFAGHEFAFLHGTAGKLNSLRCISLVDGLDVAVEEGDGARFALVKEDELWSEKREEMSSIRGQYQGWAQWLTCEKYMPLLTLAKLVGL